MFLVFFGVILPAIALGIELTSGMSADIFIDPIPTYWHIALVGLVPIANGLALWMMNRGHADRPTTLILLNGLAMGVSAIYGLIYLPISFAGIMFIPFFGIGLLPISPIASFVSSIVVCYRLLRHSQTTRPEVELHEQQDEDADMHANQSIALYGRSTSIFRPGPLIALSIVAGVGLLLAGEVPALLTEHGLNLATSTVNEKQEYGIQFLRRFSNEQTLAARCLNRRPSSLLQKSAWSGNEEQMREIFFRATGKPLNSITVKDDNPTAFRGSWDNGLGGKDVANQVEGLSLTSSRLDTAVDADTSVAYTEWTMQFTNDHVAPNEARAQILLPPGGVVSRLTLWVNGEPREAAFSGTSHVRSAYQKVAVRQQRDPVLVTWKGKDRVLMQCFPVPANGGTMKVRMGITAPVQWKTNQGKFVPPQIIEQNFAIAESLGHAIWLNGDVPLTSASRRLVGKSANSQYSLSGLLPSKEMDETSIFIDQEPSSEEFWVKTEGDDMIYGTLRPERTGLPTQLIVVVDGSKGMRDHLDEIAAGLRMLHSDSKVKLLLAGDDVHDLTSFLDGERGNGQTSEADAGQLSKAMRQHLSRGGTDNTAAIVQAWDQAGDQAEIVWIHGSQPINQSHNLALSQRIDNDSVLPPIWDFQILPGPNRIMEGFNDRLDVQRISFAGKLATDLTSWWKSLDERTWTVDWKKADLTEVSAETDQQVTLLDQPKAEDLWAWSHVREVLRDNRRKSAQERRATRDAITQFAAAHHLVTPVSGAVVLETQEQYDQAGLTPIDQQKQTPTLNTPEPAGNLIALIMMLPVVHFARRQRKGLRAR